MSGVVRYIVAKAQSVFSRDAMLASSGKGTKWLGDRVLGSGTKE